MSAGNPSSTVQIYGVHHPSGIRYPARVNANGSMEVILQDQTTNVIQLYMLIEQGTVILSAPTVSGTNTLTVDDATDIESGTMLELFVVSGTRWMQSEVLSVNSGTGALEIDRLHDWVFESGSATTGYFGTKNLAVSGTIGTPIIARAFNKDLHPVNAEWDMNEVSIHVENGGEMAGGEFGNIARLKYGIQFRGQSIFGTYNNHNMKTNQELLMFTDFNTYSTKAGGGTAFSWTFKKYFGGQSRLGVTTRWRPAYDIYAELVIMDNLEALDVVEVYWEGSYVLP